MQIIQFINPMCTSIGVHNTILLSSLSSVFSLWPLGLFGPAILVRKKKTFSIEVVIIPPS
jgi:hypothetical protein